MGNVRAGLYNWLFARHHGGVFILRSDDTDLARSSPEFHQDIVGSMRWLGLDWDEGVEAGGPHAPYRQSERLDRYRDVVDQLIDAGKAYRCFCTPEELDERRKAAQKEGRPPGYDGRCRSIEPDESVARADAEPFSVRLAIPRPGATTFDDVVRGTVTFDHENVDDFVMLRSSGMPTYQLASAVDDVDFAITHVVRGEDLLSSTPKHILIGDAIGGAPITYAHLSMIQGPDGKKLSKRHGDTSLRSYRESGILPEALVNYLALLGWSPGDDETVVSLETMVERFDLDAVSRNPAIFDTAKLEWMNGVYIRELDNADFVARTLGLVEADLGRPLDESERATFEKIAPLVQERAKRLTEIPAQVRFLFGDVSYDETAWVKVMGGEEAPIALGGAAAVLEDLDEWSTDAIEGALRAMLEANSLSARKGLQPLRVALSGSTVSPPLFESMEALGGAETLRRLRNATDRL